MLDGGNPYVEMDKVDQLVEGKVASLMDVHEVSEIGMLFMIL